ncbi:hypothetical protein BH23BAC3_BH23BAC3_04460 [soil metagenome]
MKFTPFRITLIYLMVALVWIASTDAILENLVNDVSLLTSLQTVKGWFYVCATALGLFVLIKAYEKQISTEKNKLERIDKSLNMALESANIAAWKYFVDTDSYITSSHHNAFFGYSESKNMNLNDVFERMHTGDTEEFRNKVYKTLKTGREFNVEYRIIHPDKQVRWLWTKGHALTDNGKVDRVVGITTDITESKNLKKKLDLEREKFEALFDQIPVLITVFNPELEILEVNKEFEKVLGWSANDQKEKSMMELCYPDEEYRQEVSTFMEKPGTGWKELEVVAKSGEVRTQLWSNLKLSDSTVVGIGHDISKRKKLEKQNQKDKESILKIFNNLPIFINIYDDEGIIVDFNDYTGERLGYSKEEIKAGDFLNTLVREDDAYLKARKHMKNADRSWEYFDIYTRHGEVLSSNWMNMELSDELKIGVGLDLTEIKDLEEQLTQAVKGGGVGIWDFYPQGGNIIINDEWAQMLGYSREELEPMNYEKWKEITHPEDVAETERLLELHTSGEIPSYDNEIRMRHKEGHWVWMLDRGEITERDADGNVVRLSGTHIDISDRKHLQEKIDESKERLKLAAVSANVGMWEWNPQTDEVIVDEVWARLVGYSLDELQPVNIETWNNLVHPADLERFGQIVEDYFNNETDMYECEFRMRHKDGRWIWILDRGKTVEQDENGKPIRMVGTHVDITARKTKEVELKESERLLRQTQRVANLGTYTLDIESGQLQTSEILDQMFWISDNEKLTNKSWKELLHPDYKYIAENYRKAMVQGLPFEAEYKILNVKNNRERWIYEKADVELNSNGRVVRAIGVMMDVTRTKEQQQRIKRTLEQLTIAEQIAEVGYWEKNLLSGKLFWGDNKYELFEADKTKGPLSRKELISRIHKEDKDSTYKAFVQAEKNGNLDISYRYKISDGTYRTIREKGDIVTDSNTDEQILRGISMDISSLREIESKLEDERKRLRIITSLISDVIWNWDLENDKIEWSEGMNTVFGYNPATLAEGKESWIDRIHPDDKEFVQESIQKSIKGDATFWSEDYRFIDSSDEVRYVLDEGYIYRNSEGKAVQMIGAMIDKTEEKRAEMVLSYQANLLSDISDAVIATDKVMNITSWNRAAEELYGWSEQEVLGKEIEAVIITEFEKISEDKTLEVFKSEGEWSGEVIQYDKNNEPIHILSSVRMLTDNEGEFSGAVAVNKDITALKEIQKRLEYEQSRFEYVTTVVSDAVWDHNPAENTLWWSEGLESHYKHKQPDPKRGYEVWKNNIHPDDREEVLKDIQAAEDGGDTEWSKEYRFYRGDGSLAIVLDRAYILRDNDGEITRIIGAMNDVTIQKEAQKKLARSEQQYRLLYEQSPLPMWIYDPKTFLFLSVNNASIETYGYSEDEFMKMTIFDLFLEEDQAKIRKEVMENLKRPRSGFDVWRLETKSGNILHCEVSGSDIYFKDEQHRLVVSIDITEQRKAEERTIKAIVEGEERERHRIANELHDGLGQYLSAANMHLGTVFSDSKTLNKNEKQSFVTGLQMLQHAISETRSISHNLLPKSIQDYGLKLAVESLINDLKSSQDMAFHLFQKYDDEFIPDNIQINVYRIIQEAINNAIKHSGGANINTQLIYSDNELICTIEDDGVGFDVKNIQNEGLGVQSIKTRVAAMSGNLDIDSKQNIGTLITVIVPLEILKTQNG